MIMFLLLLIPTILAASFTSEKRDYQEIMPKWELRSQLAKAEGFPNVKDLEGWMMDVVSKGSEVSEDVARGVMLSCWNPSLLESFFNHVMDKHAYVSLVKDMADYDGMSDILLCYFQKYRLRHFPDLPESLRMAMEEVKDISSVARFLLPVISDYSINHRRIIKKVEVDNSSPAVLKVTLLCYCLGAMELGFSYERKYYFKPTGYEDLAIIEEVAKEFPEKMHTFIAGLSPDDQIHLQLYRSNQPPSEDFWNRTVEHTNWLLPNMRCSSDYFTELEPLLRDLIHHLFQHHRDWILEHFPKLIASARLHYFHTQPEDCRVDLLPEETPSVSSMLPRAIHLRHFPLFHTLITKYGMDALNDSADKYYEQCRQSSIYHYCDKTPTIRPMQMVKLIDPKYHSDLVENRSFNQIFTILHYTLHLAFTDDEFAAWLVHFLRSVDPAVWAPFLLNPKISN